MGIYRRKIFGIGTGPGDPELLTLKAIRCLRESELIFAPTSRGKHLALDTALALSLIHISEPTRPLF